MYWKVLLYNAYTKNILDIKQRTYLDDNYWIEYVENRAQTCMNEFNIQILCNLNNFPRWHSHAKQ